MVPGMSATKSMLNAEAAAAAAATAYGHEETGSRDGGAAAASGDGLPTIRSIMGDAADDAPPMQRAPPTHAPHVLHEQHRVGGLTGMLQTLLHLGGRRTASDTGELPSPADAAAAAAAGVARNAEVQRSAVSAAAPGRGTAATRAASLPLPSPAAGGRSPKPARRAQRRQVAWTDSPETSPGSASPPVTQGPLLAPPKAAHQQQQQQQHAEQQQVRPRMSGEGHSGHPPGPLLHTSPTKGNARARSSGQVGHGAPRADGARRSGAGVSAGGNAAVGAPHHELHRAPRGPQHGDALIAPVEEIKLER
uniref:Uncharacterized protein n=2 Tax=Chlamydomonas euryale TaxID=1486919 RepID=A0A7R9YSC3_9CHLO